MQVTYSRAQGETFSISIEKQDDWTWSHLRDFLEKHNDARVNYFLVDGEPITSELELIDRDIIQVQSSYKTLAGKPINVVLKVGTESKQYPVQTDTAKTWKDFKSTVFSIHAIKCGQLLVEEETVRFDHETLADYNIAPNTTILAPFYTRAGDK